MVLNAVRRYEARVAVNTRQIWKFERQIRDCEKILALIGTDENRQKEAEEKRWLIEFNTFRIKRRTEEIAFYMAEVKKLREELNGHQTKLEEMAFHAMM